MRLVAHYRRTLGVSRLAAAAAPVFRVGVGSLGPFGMLSVGHDVGA